MNFEVNLIFLMVLEQLPPRKISPSPKTNPNPNPSPNWGLIFLEGNCLVAPNPKTNPKLVPNPNPNRGQLSSEGNCPDALSNRTFFLHDQKTYISKTLKKLMAKT